MSSTRREFIKTTAATAASLAALGPYALEPSAQTLVAPDADPLVIEIANEALNAARATGASYADVRVARYRQQSVATRERQVSGVSDTESYGLGVRTLLSGCWGFAATSDVTLAGAQKAAREAAVMSRAARAVQKHRVELATVTPVKGTWMTPVRRDPLEGPIEKKLALLFAANEAALKAKNVRFVSSRIASLREFKTLLTSEGTNVTQTLIRVAPSFSATATGAGDFQIYQEEIAPRGEGWEYVESLDLPGNAERWASIAA